MSHHVKLGRERALLPLLLGVLCAGAALAAPAKREAPWTAEALELAGSLPVQDRGRVKPLSTFAGFQLLKLNGKRTVKLESKEKPFR